MQNEQIKESTPTRTIDYHPKNLIECYQSKVLLEIPKVKLEIKKRRGVYFNDEDERYLLYKSLAFIPNVQYRLRLKVLSRNVLYSLVYMGVPVSCAPYFIDVFRGHSRTITFDAFVNIIIAFDLDANRIFKTDIVSQDIEKGVYVKWFGYKTYRVSSDLWDLDTIEELKNNNT